MRHTLETWTPDEISVNGGKSDIADWIVNIRMLRTSPRMALNVLKCRLSWQRITMLWNAQVAARSKYSKTEPGSSKRLMMVNDDD